MENSSGKANDANRAALLRKRNYSLCDETVLLCHGPFNALIPIRKNEISVTEPGHPLIWTHRKTTGLIWRDPKFARPHWISCQRSIPFVCAQISGIATGQALQLLKKSEIIAFFIFFKIRIRLLLVTWRGEKRTLTGKSWLPSTLFPANIWTLPYSSSILKRPASSWSVKRIPLNGASSVLWFLNDLAFTGSEL